MVVLLTSWKCLFRALDKFLSISQDVVVVKFTFRRVTATRRHQHIRNLIIRHFEPKMVLYDPREAFKLTLNDCWDQGKHLIVALEEFSTWNGQPISSNLPTISLTTEVWRFHYFVKGSSHWIYRFEKADLYLIVGHIFGLGQEFWTKKTVFCSLTLAKKKFWNTDYLNIA